MKFSRTNENLIRSILTPTLIRPILIIRKSQI